MATNGPNLMSQDLNGPQVAGGLNWSEKYGQERDKRMNQGVRTYIDVNHNDQFKSFSEDIWLEPGKPINNVLKDGSHIKFLVFGAGYGGLLFAVNLIKQGYKPDDIAIIDTAGGFGGTWYWNRYPGLMCDTESYIYMPLLEETGFVPSMKYASGYELLEYANIIATKYDLQRRAMFTTSGKHLQWNAATGEWDTTLVLQPKGESAKEITVHAQYTFINAGVLNNPHLPETQGIYDYKQPSFHTSRWRYDITGGTPENPTLDKLKDKVVGIIGTGATAVQSVPHLAKWSKKLYVFQRTPSAIDIRDNRPTDKKDFAANVANNKGWWQSRNENFHSFIANEPNKPEVNMINDGWTKAPTLMVMCGGQKTVTMEDIGQHIQEMNSMDITRQDRIRARASQVVKDPETANKLQAWYQSWCKRPCFHDEYLQAFNQPNVELIDTAGKGIEKLSTNGIVVDGKEYPLDIIVWGTGFRSPAIGTPADKCGMTVTGVDGLTMEKKNEDGLTTLHGVVSRGFPNMFWPGPFQFTATPNQMYTLNLASSHVASMIATANTGLAEDKHAVLQPTPEGEEAWAMQVMSGAMLFAPVSGCTPGYMNREGAFDKVEDQAARMKMARMSIFSQGPNVFTKFLRAWEAKGDLEGLEVVVV